MRAILSACLTAALASAGQAAPIVAVDDAGRELRLERPPARIVTLEEAQSDPIYQSDPDFADPRGGTLTELMMQARGIAWPEGHADKPREKLRTLCQ